MLFNTLLLGHITHFSLKNALVLSRCQRWRGVYYWHETCPKNLG